MLQLQKKIIAIITGETIFPNKIPSLNQKMFKGVKSLELQRPSIRKIREIRIAHNLYVSLFSKGQNAIIIKTIKKTKPKLLFELLFIFIFLLIINNTI